MVSASSACAATETPAQRVVRSEASRGGGGAGSGCSEELREEQAGSRPKKAKQQMNGVHLRQKTAQTVGSCAAASSLCRDAVCLAGSRYS